MEKQKTCFVIMPISDQDGYEKGHFTRVYQHLIKPACEKAGFVSVRADDEIKTNYIVIDIIRKILESDIVICDLSSKNPNVLYELGIRQAFNKKSVLIKDSKTARIFDIQGLRTIDYDANLRIDEVQKNINTISLTLAETYDSKSEDINSLIQLLSIKPAEIKSGQEISLESQLIMDSLSEISKRLIKLETGNNFQFAETPKNYSKIYDVNGHKVVVGETLYTLQDVIGDLVDVHENSIFVEKDNKITEIKKNSKLYKELYALPF